MKIESKILYSQNDLDFESSIFLPLVGWNLSVMKGHVVIFENGNVLLTEDHKANLQQTVEQMARHFLLPQQFFVATPALIKELLDSMSGFEEVMERNEKKDQREDLTAAQEDLRDLIGYAMRNQISDIHLEVRKNHAKIRCRRYGEMTIYKEWLALRALRVCFVAFNRESDDVKKHFNTIVPHDASMELEIDGRRVRVRLGSVPAYPYPSFDVVFRILTMGEDRVLSIDELGYTLKQKKIFEIAMARKSGAIILAGATGSGKTTTLASLVQLIPKEKKIYTIEDPVEKKLMNATQIPTNHDNPLSTFGMLVRQTLRMDPDCIVIGEVRDENTASMMARASITGHLVLSTLHANSAINIVLRLKDLGLDMNVLTDPDFLTILCYQVLLKKLCDHCKVLSDHLTHRALLGENYVKGHDKRCLTCKGKGVVGRIVAAEVIRFGERELNYIRHNQAYEWSRDLEKREESLKYRVLDLIREGVVSVEDAESAIGYIDELHMSEE
jgi:type II secretory ATPase GspE/PulE/Tfp pilus assembly ATPase PilB-like protein